MNQNGIYTAIVAGLFLMTPLMSGCVGMTTEASIGSALQPEDTGLRETDAPLVDFGFAPGAPLAGQAIQFKDQSRSPAEIVYYAWDFGDSTGVTAKNPTHSYKESGAYTVTLRVKNSLGLESSKVYTVNVGAKLPNSPAEQSVTPEVIPEEPLQFMEFGQAVTLGPGGEPSLSIDSKGNFYVNPPGGLWRSTDGGQSFTQLPTPVDASGDSQVVVDRNDNDRVYLLNLVAGTAGKHLLPIPACVCSTSVYTSQNQGESWDAGSLVTGGTVSNDRPWLATAGDGTAYMSYALATPINSWRVVMKTTDGGTTWNPLPRTFPGWFQYLFVDQNDGTLYIGEADWGNKQMKVYVSKDGGENFDEQVVAKRSEESLLMFNGAVDDAGNTYIVWSDRANNESQFNVYLSASNDQGQTWSEPILVSPNRGTHIFPWVAARGNGEVVVAWYSATEKADPNKASNQAVWHVWAAKSKNIFANRPAFAASQVTPMHDPVKTGAICTGGINCPNGENRDLLDFFMVQIAPNGKAAIAYAVDENPTNTGWEPAVTRFILEQ